MLCRTNFQAWLQALDETDLQTQSLKGWSLSFFELLISLSISGSRAYNGTKEITIVTTGKFKKRAWFTKKHQGMFSFIEFKAIKVYISCILILVLFCLTGKKGLGQRPPEKLVVLSSKLYLSVWLNIYNVQGHSQHQMSPNVIAKKFIMRPAWSKAVHDQRLWTGAYLKCHKKKINCHNK